MLWTKPIYSSMRVAKWEIDLTLFYKKMTYHAHVYILYKYINLSEGRDSF